MGRARRQITSQCMYEICFRARRGLPFAAYDLIKLIIGASVARTQRDDKVELCHDIWNGSHCHMIVVTKDSAKCVQFYSEIQKRITDILKRLLGLDHLQIWEGRVTVARILDVETAIERISYLYANPAQDNLVRQIEDFPGYSSWQQFVKISHAIEAEAQEHFPWIRLPSVPKLRSPVLSFHEDRVATRYLRQQNKVVHSLVRRPNIWMSCFEIESGEEVAQINARIIDRLKMREEEALKQGKVPLGAHRMRKQPIMKDHTPKKRERRIYVLCSYAELRIGFIKAFKEFCSTCYDCYQKWCNGDFSIDWPPGAFKPPIPPNMNVLPA